MTAELVVRPSWSMAKQRLKFVAVLAVVGLLFGAVISVRAGTNRLPLLLMLGLAMFIAFSGGWTALALYVRNASLISGPGYIAWTGMTGRRLQHTVEGLELSRVTSDVSGTRVPLLKLAWPADHRLFRLDVGLWEPSDLERWRRAVGVPVAPAPAGAVNELDLANAYANVLGRPRGNDATFLVGLGGGILIVVAAVIFFFYR